MNGIEYLDDAHDHDHDHDHIHGGDEATFHEILHRYAAAWDADDLETILDTYHTPCAIYKDGVLEAIPDEATKRRHFGELLERYRAGGLVGTEMADFSFLDLGHNSALVTVRWTSQRADGRVASDYLDSYHFGRIDGAWKILDDTVHD
jgi:hypothetical protein